MPNKIPTKADFQEALDEFFRESEEKGYSHRDLKAYDLHVRAAGKLTSDNNRMPLCCDVMKENRQRQLGDKILHEPPKGCGTLLEIRYVFPRTTTQIISSKDVWRKCEFCEGTGIDPGRGVADVTGEKCRVCGKSKRKGFNKVPEYYIKCKGECKGKGRIDITGPFDPFPNFRPCRDCGGTGWADPSKFE